MPDDGRDGAATAPAQGIEALLAGYRSGETDPERTLAAIHEAAGIAPAGEAVIDLLPSSAAAAADSARRWREGRARPLEGVPFGVKGIIDVEGGLVTCGSYLTGDQPAKADAPVVARLRDAGAIPVAMLATTEYAAGSPFTPRHGPVTNPWDAERWTGGSSTGSGAAVARRLLPLALGTDTGGSIRVPSCWCGITGLKPTRGRVPTDGVAELSATLDHVGPMGLSARDLDLAMGALCGMTPVRPRSLRIGVLDGWFEDMVDDAVLAARDAAIATFRAAGAEIERVSTGDLLGEMADIHDAGWTILMAELAEIQSANAPHRERQDEGLRARIARGEAIVTADYIKALKLRATVIERAAARWGVNLMLTPGLGGEAGCLDTLTIDVNGRQEGFDMISRNTMIWDLTGFPALMLPAGFGRTNLPVGIQIVGLPGEDALCLAAGRMYQNATRHHLCRP
ncbi:amidase [Palleronia sp. LCG004]|uniref:amidase n=1 Tax=Palleronia sp. LCG004 TaxID=3079304 RepID=UPI002941DC65|nr:amidase [Palleronia sp. LCG004]WOI58024.1 amidase [Palleronia sp. LCG004]